MKRDTQDLLDKNSLTVGELDGHILNPEKRTPIKYTSISQSRSKSLQRKYQRVLLVSPPATLYFGDLPRCTYPLGLGYLGAVLEKNEYEVQILDCLVEGYHQKTVVAGDKKFITYGLGDNEVRDIIAKFRPDVLGISSIFSNQADQIASIFAIAKQVDPSVKLVTGGAHARYFPGNYLQDLGADAVFLGESEATFLQYLEYLNGAGEIEHIHGIMVNVEGNIVKNDQMPLIKKAVHMGVIEELDEIPYPAWHLFNMEKYFSIGAYQSPYTVGDKVGQIYTSRGCTAKCTFCTTTNFWGGKLRRRSAQNVIGEIEALKSLYGINEFHIQDDNITNDKAHAKHLFSALKEVGLPWCTPQGTALWRMDKELLDLMRSSGCYQVTFAVESGVQRVLSELIRKPLDLNKTFHLIQYARDIGMSTHGFFIIGMPPMFGNRGETIREMWKTYEYAKNAGFNSASFFTATPIVGSVLLTECLRQGFIAKTTPLYRMSYKQGLISVPDLWKGEEIAKLANQFNVDFNGNNTLRNSNHQWNAKQY